MKLCQNLMCVATRTPTSRTRERASRWGSIEIVSPMYRAQIDTLGTGKGIAFPIGSSVFQTRFAPSDSWDTVGTTGIPLYARTYPDVEGDRYQRLEVQTNVLNINTDPACVVGLDDGA